MRLERISRMGSGGEADADRSCAGTIKPESVAMQPRIFLIKSEMIVPDASTVINPTRPVVRATSCRRSDTSS